jgi:peptidoglycan/xylan/chitin deacetylase (PgdA/CDA1 family)
MIRRLLFAYNILSLPLLLVLWACGHPWWGLAVCFLGHMALLWAVLRPGCQWLGPVSKSLGQKEIYLTFDDGPDPEDTPWILDQLAAADLKAIFFLIGDKCEQHPDLVQKIAAAGHEIGNHTASHPQFAFWRLGPRRIREEVDRCQQILTKITGTAPRFFRAPAGHQNPFLAPVLAKLKLQHLGWTARGFDGTATDPDKILHRLLPQIKSPGIVLLHEGKKASDGGSLIRQTLPDVIGSILRQQPYVK